MTIRISFLMLLLVFACKEKVSVEVTSLISTLDTTEKQIAFLNEIANKDQEVRQADIAAIENYGLNSKEHKASLQRMLEADSENLAKIQEYLRQYGHPKIMTHGERESMVPWLIVYHAPGGFNPKKQNFTNLLEGYINGDLDGGSLLTLMEKMHVEKFNQDVEWSKPLSDNEKIETLIRAMEL